VNVMRAHLLLILIGSLAVTTANASSAFDAELAAIQQQWAEANYATKDPNERKQAFERLSERAHRFSQDYPTRAEPLIWEGIVLSSYAGVKGGLGALGLAKRSRSALEAAMKIEPNALDGSAYTSLGALYSKVPGFPLGFGDDEKAEQFLRKALEINPDGIDPNYFYAQYLCDRKRCAEAREYLERASAAAPRPGRQLADEGRHREIDALMQSMQ
jgi:tetratricopeptide (TPR) repeat protein